jgi:hypothetical protein
MEPPRIETDPLLHPEEVEGAPRRSRRWVQWVVYAVALGLLGACIAVGYGEFQAGWDKLRAASAADLGIMLAMIAANLVLDGFVFWAVLIPFRPPRPVTLREMTALVSATALLNYLPMRAGMIGRAAYLKQRHGVNYRDSVVMLLAVAAMTVAIYLMLGGLSLATGGLNAVWWIGSVLGLGLMAWLGVEVLRHGRWLMPKFVVRYFDDAHAAIGWLDKRRVTGVLAMWLVLVARAAGFGSRVVLIWMAARVFETPISATGALMLAICGTFVTLATPLPNGLGLREGIYGLLAAAGVAGAAISEGSTGVALGLVERAVEAIGFVIAGTVGLLYVHRRKGV